MTFRTLGEIVKDQRVYGGREKARILLIDGLVDVFEEPSTQREKLVADADNVAAFGGAARRSACARVRRRGASTPSAPASARDDPRVPCG
jgi:hypothetical protein